MGEKGRLRRFGLIGYPLGHSLSPLIHERIMAVMGLPGEYRLYELEPESMSNELPKLFATLDGFNCTIPHKEAIIPYLKGLAPSASLYGAVNTVHERTGYNTDGAGFASCNVPMQGRKVCVLGAGGVARVLTMEAVRARSTGIYVLARNAERAERLVHEVKEKGYDNIHAVKRGDDQAMDCEVLLNGTPVGMWPDVGGVPITDRQLRSAKIVFDTIYNPSATRLVLQAKTRGLWAKGGLQMLFEQALASQKIWNPEVNLADFRDELEQAQKQLAREVLQNSPIKLVLTGFMGSGKTHVGRALAMAMSLPFLDLDEQITKDAGQSITEIFSSRGEEAFRKLEREAFLDQIYRPGAMVLATGGGTLMQEGMVESLRQYQALIIHLDVPLEVALQRIGDDQNRPLILGDKMEVRNLFERRRPMYEAAADLTVPALGEVVQVVEAIMTAFGWNA